MSGAYPRLLCRFRGFELAEEAAAVVVDRMQTSTGEALLQVLSWPEQRIVDGRPNRDFDESLSYFRLAESVSRSE